MVDYYKSTTIYLYGKLNFTVFSDRLASPNSQQKPRRSGAWIIEGKVNDG